MVHESLGPELSTIFLPFLLREDETLTHLTLKTRLRSASQAPLFVPMPLYGKIVYSVNKSFPTSLRNHKIPLLHTYPGVIQVQIEALAIVPHVSSVLFSIWRRVYFKYLLVIRLLSLRRSITESRKSREGVGVGVLGNASFRPYFWGCSLNLPRLCPLDGEARMGLSIRMWVVAVSCVSLLSLEASKANIDILVHKKQWQHREGFLSVAASTLLCTVQRSVSHPEHISPWKRFGIAIELHQIVTIFFSSVTRMEEKRKSTEE